MENASFKEVLITEVKDGAELARSVVNNDGIVVLEIGAQLNERLINRLKNMGIKKLCIKANQVPLKEVEIEKIVLADGVGAELGKDVVSKEGVVVVEKGTKLTERLVNFLCNMGIKKVFITETNNGVYQRKPLKAVKPNVFSAIKKTRKEILEHSIKQQIQNISEIAPDIDLNSLLTIYEQALIIMKRILDNVRGLHVVHLEELELLAKQVIKKLILVPQVIKKIGFLQKRADYTSKHSVNVAIISGVIAKLLEFKEDEFEELIFTALVHDVGKSQIPWDILQKPGNLLPQELMVAQYHVKMGYDLLVMTNRMNERILQGVLQHHERLDGSGYPKSLRDKQISQYARIIAVADMFDAMTAERNYKQRQNPLSVLDKMHLEQVGKLDKQVFALFAKNMSAYYLNCKVLLNDGRVGKITDVEIGKQRPVVKLLNKDLILDLNKEASLYIMEILGEAD